jgi:hypothetical protein
LVYFESFDDVRNAIDREKRIKGWLRIKKIQLIVSINPAWKDLSDGWYERHLYTPDGAEVLPLRHAQGQNDTGNKNDTLNKTGGQTRSG